MRIGRGGKRGKTSGRGTKGQNARAGHRKRPEIRDFIKKLPKRRGYGKNRADGVVGSRVLPTVISLTRIDAAFAAGDAVNPKTLAEKKIISTVGGRLPKVKILGGEITKKITLTQCTISQSAKSAIEAKGGTVNG